MHTGTEDLLKLRELPELAPPPGGWERVLAAQHARAASRRVRFRIAAAAAVAVLTGALGYVGANLSSKPAPTLQVAVRPSGESELRLRSETYAPLVAESARLERLLAELPAPRPLAVASTASAVVGLENRIASVDEQLSYAAARDLAPSYREALWGERVELMNALVHVRFAQIQGY